MGGIASAGMLLVAGHSKDAVQRAQVRGEIVRVRRGIYAAPGARPDTVRAARVGGALAGVSAAEFHKLWEPPHKTLHVSVAADAHHLKHPDHTSRTLEAGDGVAVLRDRKTFDPDLRMFVVPLLTCLEQSLRTVPEEYAIAMLDSALHVGRDAAGQAVGPLMTAEQYRTLQLRMPARFQSTFAQVEPRADTGSESVARVRALRAGIPVRAQVWVADGIRADLVVGDRMLIEIGSIAHHSTPRDYNRDRDREAILNGYGFLTLEFSNRQVMWDWPTVEAVIFRKMDRGEHLR
ncbi:MAG: DUF559 domain-containing protein [Microbacteriaceae bacterium]